MDDDEQQRQEGFIETVSIGNECGTCTACCTSLGFTGSTEEFDPNPEGTKALGIDYDFGNICNKVCDYGCTIYNMRPEPCRSFECAYILHDLPFEHRPDQSGVITEVKKFWNGGPSWVHGVVMTVEKSGVSGITSTEFRDKNRELLEDIIEQTGISLGKKQDMFYLVSKKEQIVVWR